MASKLNVSTLKPLGLSVIILLEKRGEYTVDCGDGKTLIMPGTEKPSFNRAKIVAIGPEVKKVEVGQVVIYKPDMDTVPFKDGTDDYNLIIERNILAIV